jgi:hypothetical protein
MQYCHFQVLSAVVAGFVNNFDEPVAFQCDGDGYVAGISSYHSDRYEDRRFNFYCCKASGKCLG